MISPSCSKSAWPGQVGERKERYVALVMLALILILRIVEAWTYGVDSDEGQHMHVVWGWLNGRMQYRDLFDNHMPLFQILCVPLLKIIGERANVIVLARLGMIPLYLLSMWGIYRIGCRLRSPRMALWGTVFAASDSIFFLRSLEFRTDDLWALLWIFAILILVDGPMSWKRAGCWSAKRT